MEQRLPPLQWLRSFEAAARHMSFTAAAAELAITQSAVSQQVKALEQFLGQALFLRRVRSLQLTDAGRHYLETVAAALKVLADGTQEFFGHDPTGVVEIKANTAFSVLWLAPRLADFKAACPEARIFLSTAMWEADFAGGQGSVEIRFGRGEWRGEVSEKLAGASLLPVAAPAVAKRLTRIEDLAGETLLHLAAIHHDWAHWLQAVGHPELKGREAQTFNTFVLSLTLARLGRGVAMAHELLVGDMLAAGELVAPFDQAVPAPVGYYLVVSRGAATNPATETFCDWLRDQFR